MPLLLGARSTETFVSSRSKALRCNTSARLTTCGLNYSSKAATLYAALSVVGATGESRAKARQACCNDDASTSAIAFVTNLSACGTNRTTSDVRCSVVNGG